MLPQSRLGNSHAPCVGVARGCAKFNGTVALRGQHTRQGGSGSSVGFEAPCCSLYEVSPDLEAPARW